MKNLLYLLMILPFAVKAQITTGNRSILFDNPNKERITTGNSSIIIGNSGGFTLSSKDSLVIGYPPLALWATLEAPARRNNDTVKVVMLVSDTSEVQIGRNIIIGSIYGPIGGYQDTRPFMMYGYQTSTGELLDAYKQKLSKNYVMWIAYKTN